MSACTFFGHRDCPNTVKDILRSVIVDLIIQRNVNMFYVGNQGNFDTMVHSVLQELQKQYPHIHYAVVLAYMPGKRDVSCVTADTLFPEGLELVPPRYAVSRRNQWMIERSEYVVTYIRHNFGGAYTHEALAKRHGKAIIRLTEDN